ncbi:MAG: hypothetical protein K2L99_07580 [Muribaculaceae bacterium]|nr:hypothetical protein [Muribaculaceae bacterium]
MRAVALLSAMAVWSCTAALTGVEQRLKKAGDVDVGAEVPGVMVDMMYGRADNFTGRVLYDSLHHAFLHPDAARALARARKELNRLAPGTYLLVKDAARPVGVQRSMFNAVRGTSKARYVANPANGGGTHNYGVAVDVTLCDSLGRELPMGTPVDHLGPESHIEGEEALVARGAITREELARRRLLRRVMRAAGFLTIRKEWWHFELVRRATAAGRYPLIDF